MLNHNYKENISAWRYLGEKDGVDLYVVNEACDRDSITGVYGDEPGDYWSIPVRTEPVPEGEDIYYYTYKLYLESRRPRREIYEIVEHMKGRYVVYLKSKMHVGAPIVIVYNGPTMNNPNRFQVLGEMSTFDLQHSIHVNARMYFKTKEDAERAISLV